MKKHTPLNVIISGAQTYLKLEARSIRLRSVLALADAAYGIAKLVPAVIAGAIALVFLGIALALWIATFLSAPAGFAITGVLFIVLIPVSAAILKSKKDFVKDRMVAAATNSTKKYKSLETEHREVESELAQKSAELEQQFSELKERVARIERFISPAGDKAGGLAGNLLRTAAGSVVQHALLPKAGLIGKIVGPAVTGAVMRSGVAKKLVSRLFSLIRRK